MNLFKALLVLLAVFLLNSESRSQFADLKFKTGKYTFQTKFDTATYTTLLKVKKEREDNFQRDLL